MLIIQRPEVEAGEDEGNRQRFAIGPLEPGFGHTLGNTPAPHPAVVDPRRGGHPGPLRRRAPRVHHHPGREGGRHRHHLEPQGPGAAVRSRRAGHPAPRQARARRRHRRRHPDHRRRRGPEPRPAHRHRSTPRAASPSTSPSSRAAATCRPSATSGPSTIGVIPVDSIFSPVRRVAFSIEPTRVEQATNYDRLDPRDRDRRVDLAARGAGLGRRHAAQPGRPGRRPDRRARRASSSARWRRRQRRRPTSTCRSRSSTCPSGPATA